VLRFSTYAKLYSCETILEWLPQDLEDMAAARGPFIQEEHPMVRRRHLPRYRHLAATDQTYTQALKSIGCYAAWSSRCITPSTSSWPAPISGGIKPSPRCVIISVLAHGSRNYNQKPTRKHGQQVTLDIADDYILRLLKTFPVDSIAQRAVAKMHCSIHEAMDKPLGGYCVQANMVEHKSSYPCGESALINCTSYPNFTGALIVKAIQFHKSQSQFHMLFFNSLIFP
jgi:hypothetical protein